jgi:UDP-N-acetylmuramate-alanine ligase
LCFLILTNGVEEMFIAGILGSEGKWQTAAIISSMLASKGEKVSTIDPAGMPGMNSKRISAYVNELEKNNIDILILKIDIPEIDKFLPDDIRFDILLYTDRADSFKSSKRAYSDSLKKVFSFMADKGIAIVNVDDSDLIKLLEGLKHRFITYGFNTKACVTTSSIGDTVYKEGFICCLQRSVSTRDGKVVEPQEYKVRLEAGGFDSHDLLAAAAFAIVNGIDLNQWGRNREGRSAVSRQQ